MASYFAGLEIGPEQPPASFSGCAVMDELGPEVARPALPKDFEPELFGLQVEEYADWKW